ncbi:methionyl-tRNA formyltransferase [Rhizosphaericola mali]|uniref:Methionyl-tRNA formyltransferase n=2 Tax=Rhizosphaericola mali TaxID=2545455 RepID=A0A5P2G9P8_9BACT|nr:methionyl-tRNA formyltransferase [Rhizosphaericola mali]
MGTPDFAVASLDALVKAGANIVGVVTGPDKQAGRGMKYTETAVKKYAVNHKLPLLQPEKLRNPIFLEELKKWNADVQIVVAFKMLPEIVWDMPPMGTINLHGSLLPKYRGAAPINWAIINGEKETGVTTFQLKHEIDTGNILVKGILPITENETAGELHDQMMVLGGKVLVETIQGLITNTISPQPQDDIEGYPAPKIFKEDCEINWNSDLDKIHNFIRGLAPYPAATTTILDRQFKIYKIEKEITQVDTTNPKILCDNKTYLKIKTKNGYASILELQQLGKKAMNIQDYLRGNKFEL